jgi:chromosome segregation ATPase
VARWRGECVAAAWAKWWEEVSRRRLLQRVAARWMRRCVAAAVDTWKEAAAEGRWAEQQRAEDTAAATLEEARQELGEVKQELGEARQELEEARRELGEVKQELGEARRELGEARRELGEVKQELEVLRGEHGTCPGIISGLRNELETGQVLRAQAKTEQQARRAEQQARKAAWNAGKLARRNAALCLQRLWVYAGDRRALYAELESAEAFRARARAEEAMAAWRQAVDDEKAATLRCATVCPRAVEGRA